MALNDLDNVLAEVMQQLQNKNSALNKETEQAAKKLREEQLKKDNAAAITLQKELSQIKSKDLLKEKQIQIWLQNRANELKNQQLDEELTLLKKYSEETKKRTTLESKIVATKERLLKAEQSGNRALIEKENRSLHNYQNRQNAINSASNYHFGYNISDKFNNFRQDKALAAQGKLSASYFENTLLNTVRNISHQIQSFGNQINNTVKSYADFQVKLNTRLQGVSNAASITGNLKNVAYSPLVNAQTLYSNVSSLVGSGIVTNVEQRAFFMTIKEAIADTFNADSPTLRELIRVQQADSTAIRLGMEAYLTKFLNVYVENTEYLTQTFDNVASSLKEASILLGASANAGSSVEFEYIVQKWLGSLTGKGLSSDTATSLASALGKIGSGDVSALSGSGISNLLLMASGGNIGSYLQQGLTASDANTLLYNVSNYIKSLGGSSNNNIIKNQLAKTFGLEIQDLVALSNFSSSDLSSIYGNTLSTGQMYGELSSQMSQIAGRLGTAKILDNIFSNLNYQTGMNIASNPATYAAWMITDLIQNTTGGINIPFISALGSGIDLNTTAENLIKTGIVGVDMLSNIESIASQLNSVGSGASLLDALGISSKQLNIKRVGSSLISRTSGLDTSGVMYIGNSDSDMILNSTINSETSKYEDQLNQEQDSLKKNDPVYGYLVDIGLAEKLDTLLSTLQSIDTERLSDNREFKVVGTLNSGIGSQSISGFN